MYDVMITWIKTMSVYGFPIISCIYGEGWVHGLFKDLVLSNSPEFSLIMVYIIKFQLIFIRSSNKRLNTDVI